jgi:hypothetical protein
VLHGPFAVDLGDQARFDVVQFGEVGQRGQRQQ